MNTLALSWWDTNGAVVLLTGVVSVLSLSIGLLLRPLVETRIRRHERTERAYEAARELAADLSRVLPAFSGFGGKVLLGAARTWQEDLERRINLAKYFGPDEDLRKAAASVWLWFFKLKNYALSAEKMKDDDTPSHVQESMDRKSRTAYGEASYALDIFISELGGPDIPPRDAYPLLLKEDETDVSPMPVVDDIS